jgi:hypothetical protein
MAENYIVINGKRAELTEEQLKQLGIEVPKANPFARMGCNEDYYFIDDEGEICKTCDTVFEFDNNRFEVANYCTDKAIMEQRALHETLNRLLWRYSMEHGGTGAPVICYSKMENKFKTQLTCSNYFEPSFVSTQTAEAAIKEIVKPFMAAHPNFKW